MARQVEASQAWLESIVYQLSLMSPTEAAIKLSGPIALLKAQSTITFEYCAREASQILGGIAYTKGGVGERVERMYRDVRSMAIPGGSEEIMLDLGMKQAQKLSISMGAKL
jgi:alkylation response protein AidB-like acyl-CoA dehydrogenase